MQSNCSTRVKNIKYFQITKQNILKLNQNFKIKQTFNKAKKQRINITS